jgi:hypothetical protein
MTIRAMETALKFIFLLILYPAFFSPVSAEEQCLSCHTKKAGCQGFMILQK